MPENQAASVLSVNPTPSVPLSRGVDVVLTFRFSEPPKGSVEDALRGPDTPMFFYYGAGIRKDLRWDHTFTGEFGCFGDRFRLNRS